MSAAKNTRAKYVQARMDDWFGIYNWKRKRRLVLPDQRLTPGAPQADKITRNNEIFGENGKTVYFLV